jgi:hypothetical protein
VKEERGLEREKERVEGERERERERETTSVANLLKGSKNVFISVDACIHGNSESAKKSD